MANKIGRNKAWCKGYKDSGKREQNKRVKQQRDEKRRERFAKRREEGKVYKYDPAKSAAKIEEAFKNDWNTNSKEFKEMRDILIRDLFAPNQGSNRTKHMDYSLRRSINRKLDDEMTSRKNAIKKFSENGGGRKTAAV